MRSGDKRMLEEINRTVCDHCSDILFVYHEDYKENLRKENIKNNVYVVGNTIVEVCLPIVSNLENNQNQKVRNRILLDIHRPENFKYKTRMENIINYANICIKKYGLELMMLKFPRTKKYLEEFQLDLGKINEINLLSYKNYIETIYHCKFIISDSGTAQEEPALMGTPVIVPRDYTERPQSVSTGCTFMLDVNSVNDTWERSFEWLDDEHEIDIKWLGDGTTSDKVINHLKNLLI